MNDKWEQVGESAYVLDRIDKDTKEKFIITYVSYTYSPYSGSGHVYDIMMYGQVTYIQLRDYNSAKLLAVPIDFRKEYEKCKSYRECKDTRKFRWNVKK